MRSFSFCVFVMVLFIQCKILSQSSNLNSTLSNQGIATIPFSLSYNKTILPVKIGDSRELRIILDSGMGWDGLLIMNPNLRDSIKLIDSQETNISGGGSGNPQRALVSSNMKFTLGNIEFTDQRIVLLTTDHYKGYKNDGVVGHSIFGHYTVEIDYDKSIIVLSHPGEKIIDESWTDIPVTFNENNIPCINVLISIEDESPVQVFCYIDYASSEAIELLLKSGQKFSLPRGTEDYYLGRGLSGDIYGRRGRISKVIIGPFEVNMKYWLHLSRRKFDPNRKEQMPLLQTIF